MLNRMRAVVLSLAGVVCASCGGGGNSGALEVATGATVPAPAPPVPDVSQVFE
jgi:hypothetical protein